MRRSVVALLTVLSSTLCGQTRSDEPIKTSLCELTRNPQRFNSKLVEIRNEFVSRFQWEGFVDETCSAKVRVSAYGVFDDVGAQDGQTHLPVHPKRDHNYRAFRKYADTKFNWSDGGRCQDCPLYRILVTAKGRFDYFAGPTVAVGANRVEKAVEISGGDLPLLRFVLKSVSDVSATPIDPSVYSESKSRDVTLEEAHELVLAYLRSVGCPKQTCILERYHAADWPGLPEFYSFQAISGNPHMSFNQGYYEVDPRSGDVWNGVICERLESPFLVGLQRTIRKRIGLTDGEYKNASQDGPMCGEGMPRGGGK